MHACIFMYMCTAACVWRATYGVYILSFHLCVSSGLELRAGLKALILPAHSLFECLLGPCPHSENTGLFILRTLGLMGARQVVYHP